ncbi:MAG TPA: MBL fold metallo-hydrolase [Phototrophicaceae bacterium]|nr:MBL fold metallo-hydrolase [Phototrophicaceae bacterium]
MRVQTHGNNLIQLSMSYFPCNCYLVAETDGFTLVDTALNSAKGILAAAQRFGAIKRIALTHCHSDHVGSLDALHDLLPDVEVSISVRDARFIRGDMSLDPGEPQEKLRGGYVVVKTVPNRLLHPGDRVGSLQVIASPGHTPGHVAFLDTRDNTLIAGDAFSTQGGISTAGTLRLLFPLPALATWDKPLGLRSAESLLQWKPTRLATGHGSVLDNPVPAMQQAIDEAHRKLDGVIHGRETTH